MSNVVYGFCPAGCKYPVYTKEQVDEMMANAGGSSPVDIEVVNGKATITEAGVYLCGFGATYTSTTSNARQGTSIISIYDLTRNYKGTRTLYNYWSTSSESEAEGEATYTASTNTISCSNTMVYCKQLLKY